jgi:hypothetical protein
VGVVRVRHAAEDGWDGERRQLPTKHSTTSAEGGEAGRASRDEDERRMEQDRGASTEHRASRIEQSFEQSFEQPSSPASHSAPPSPQSPGIHASGKRGASQEARVVPQARHQAINNPSPRSRSSRDWHGHGMDGQPPRGRKCPSNAAFVLRHDIQRLGEAAGTEKRHAPISTAGGARDPAVKGAESSPPGFRGKGGRASALHRYGTSMKAYIYTHIYMEMTRRTMQTHTNPFGKWTMGFSSDLG